VYTKPLSLRDTSITRAVKVSVIEELEDEGHFFLQRFRGVRVISSPKKEYRGALRTPISAENLTELSHSFTPLLGRVLL